MSNIGLRITDGYCNGFAGARYNLVDSIIESEGKDWIVIRTTEGSPVFMNLKDWDKQEFINAWTNQNKEDERNGNA